MAGGPDPRSPARPPRRVATNDDGSRRGAVRWRRGAVLAAVGAAVVAGASVLAGAGGHAEARTVSFAHDVQPILDRSCTSCHPVSYPYLDLRAGRSYDELVRVPAATNPAFHRVLPGRPELSYLLTHPPDPSNASLLDGAELRLIERWIAEGAPDN